MTGKKPAPPVDLAARGKAFWSATVDAFELNESESRLLHEVARIMDELDELRAVVLAEGVTSRGSQGQTVAHPALAAMSSHRGILGRLLAQLNLPYADEESSLQSPAQIRARRAASVRWGTQRTVG